MMVDTAVFTVEDTYMYMYTKLIFAYRRIQKAGSIFTWNVQLPKPAKLEGAKVENQAVQLGRRQKDLRFAISGQSFLLTPPSKFTNQRKDTHFTFSQSELMIISGFLAYGFLSPLSLSKLYNLLNCFLNYFLHEFCRFWAPVLDV